MLFRKYFKMKSNFISMAPLIQNNFITVAKIGITVIKQRISVIV